ncbi:MFS general substrate transporter [Aaosphaeria arxii CBS 175.79]|uniref:MFS general substrate transporter n=1 Tax=Aaosphaeria arxii CBS 175.79 TaxID=1450172 RepID=A0A6A5XWT0_9PLEO|nr:MFS general substrate transporter [Aaosphaeria arxii CBS 175.79]KAF2016704.1 MFS general substrate transporter [Aaosphaeria arxii CBS 175.79]
MEEKPRRDGQDLMDVELQQPVPHQPSGTQSDASCELSTSSDQQHEDGKGRGTHLVDWEGDNDPENPMNWPDSKKWTNIIVLSSLSVVTPLGSSMFAPGIPSIMKEFRDSSTVTATFLLSIYILGFAVGPLFVAPLSEIYGRRHLYIYANIIFALFTIGAALSNSVGMLLAFRLLMGLSGVVPLTIGSGTIADMVSVEKRGRAVSLWAMGPLLGPCAGPAAGGFLIRAAGWRWVFWLIAILSGILIPITFFCLRETYAPVLLDQRAHRFREKTGDPHVRSVLGVQSTRSEKFRLAAVLRCTSPYPISYGILYLLIATFTYVYTEEYGFDEGSSGLVFLPAGLGMVIGVLGFGQLVDLVVKRTKARGLQHRPEDRLNPIISIPCSLAMPIGLFIYGWTIQKGIHWIVPMLGVLVICIGLMGIMTCIQNYLIDAFPKYAASVSAALAILRSLLGALLPLSCIGWGNSVLGFIALGLVPIPVLLYVFGSRLRAKFQVRL